MFLVTCDSFFFRLSLWFLIWMVANYMILVFRCTDQLGSLPTYSLSTGHLCSSYICWEGLPWTVECCRDYKHVFWASQSDGKMWPTSWQIHGLLSAVPWWCGTQGCECSYCDNQDQENHSVCGLVSNWLQGWQSRLNFFWNQFTYSYMFHIRDTEAALSFYTP